MLLVPLKPQTYVDITLPDGRVGRVALLDVHHNGNIKLGFEFPQDVRIGKVTSMEPKKGAV